MYPSTAGCVCGSSGIAVIARFCKKVLCRESNEESPESQWLFGAGLGGAQPPTFSPRKALQSQYVPAKRTYATPPLRPSFSMSLRRDRHKETHKPEINPLTPITAPTIRERATGDPDPRRNRNATSRKPSCLALTRQTAGVIEHKTSQQKRMMGIHQTQNLTTETYDGRDPKRKTFQ